MKYAYPAAMVWLALAITTVAWVSMATVRAQQGGAGTATRLTRGVAAMPQYDDNGALRLPEDWREWIPIGTSLGLGYGEVRTPMFNSTFMEPSAYRYYVDTGTFREGTMFALVVQRVASNALPPNGVGQFAGDLFGVEMAVKDSQRLAEGWGYYPFGSREGLRSVAAPQPKANCYDCHKEHAATDHVFTQFYSLLRSARP